MANVGPCEYPQSNATARSLADELDGLVANRDLCTRFYLDTKREHRNPGWDWGPIDLRTEGLDHHQGLARTHRLTDGSIYFFLTHSEMDPGEQGQLMQFRYAGPVDASHVVETSPITVAGLTQQLYLSEQHPCDVCFLPDVNNADAGYLFIAEPNNTRSVAVYAWAAGEDVSFVGSIQPDFSDDGPQWVFIDRVDDLYFLGIATNGQGRLFTAAPFKLFPDCRVGGLDIDAFLPATPDSSFVMPAMDGASQVKLVRDSTNSWFLLGFRSEPDDDPNGDDYIDVYPVQFPPTFETFAIQPRLESSRHVVLKPGDTGFASTGTHFVDDAGTLLVASSFRWSEEIGPGDSGYVSRVDEIPSNTTIVVLDAPPAP